MTKSNVATVTVNDEFMITNEKGEVSFLPTDTHSRMLMAWFDANAGIIKEETPVDLGPLPTEPVDCQSQLLLGWFADRAQDPELLLEPQPEQSRPTDTLSQMLMNWFETKDSEESNSVAQPEETPGFDALLDAYQNLCNGDGKSYIPSEWLKTWFTLPLLASKPMAKGNNPSALLADLDQKLAAFGLRSVETALMR